MSLTDLELYFSTAVMPPFPAKINPWSIIGPNHVSSQLEMARAGNQRALDRLRLFCQHLEAQKATPGRE